VRDGCEKTKLSRQKKGYLQIWRALLTKPVGLSHLSPGQAVLAGIIKKSLGGALDCHGQDAIGDKSQIV
jgi:hypothetical protein